MLIRFTIKNHLSFGQEREFNMFSSAKHTRLAHHKYSIDGFSILKMSAIYGANAAGKSNLIKSLKSLISIVKTGNIPTGFTKERFKLSNDDIVSNQILSIEFFKSRIPFYYAIEIGDNVIITEELYKSGLGKADDILIFERKTTSESTKLNFNIEFENEQENIALKNVLEKTLSKPDKSIFKLLSELENQSFIDIRTAYDWFKDNIEVITPYSKPSALAQKIDSSNSFKEFTNNILCSFDLGIQEINTEKKLLKEIVGEDDAIKLESILGDMKKNPSLQMTLRSKSGEEIIAVYEDGQVFAKRLIVNHVDNNNSIVKFYLNEESDGTNRLLDYIPLFQEVITKEKVYVIDEIERSIHPLLIKELISKFSHEEQTKGQLIFTTHESNLLDQDILRQDEIWFIEKDKLGNSDMYPLSEFKEHHTIDIRKGYLNGRYGAIPFLGNLKDLNWSKYAVDQTEKV